MFLAKRSTPPTGTHFETTLRDGARDRITRTEDTTKMRRTTEGESVQVDGMSTWLYILCGLVALVLLVVAVVYQCREGACCIATRTKTTRTICLFLTSASNNKINKRHHK